MKHYVYVYLDPESGVVRYVGSGLHDRVYKSTQPSVLKNPKFNSPFTRWIKGLGEVDWKKHRFRVIGPVTQEMALAWEGALILTHLDTTLNVRAAGNGPELKPALHPKSGPHGPRSDSGREKLRLKALRQKMGVAGVNVKPGRGISKDGNGWRVDIRVDGRRIRKRFRLYCDALTFRKELELQWANPG